MNSVKLQALNPSVAAGDWIGFQSALCRANSRQRLARLVEKRAISQLQRRPQSLKGMNAISPGRLTGPRAYVAFDCVDLERFKFECSVGNSKFAEYAGDVTGTSKLSAL